MSANWQADCSFSQSGLTQESQTIVYAARASVQYLEELLPRLVRVSSKIRARVNVTEPAREASPSRPTRECDSKIARRS
jgi:hypothetical protein